MSYIADYIGWNPTVNRVILDSSTFTIGDGATKSDELEAGGKRTKLKGNTPIDKYSVTMEFNWIKTDENGKTELQRFYEWYKYEHKYGVIPFEFPQIIYSPNSGIKYLDDQGNYRKNEYYKITSAVEGTKSGESIQMKMTWETVYSGVISYSDEVITSDDVTIFPGRNYVDLIFAKLPSTLPILSNIHLVIKNSNNIELIETEQVTGGYFDNNSTFRVFFSNIETSGTYSITASVNIKIDDSYLTVSKSASFEVV